MTKHTALRFTFLTSLLALLLLSVCLPSCKKDSWLDWKAQNAAFLVRNMQKDSIVTTPSGLQYKVIRQGIQGTKPDLIKSVRVRYKGSLITGDIFDQSDDASFAVAQVVDGLKEGLKKMNKSGHYIFYVPQELGYGKEEQGSAGVRNYIPPYSTLIFEVELLDVY